MPSVIVTFNPTGNPPYFNFNPQPVSVPFGNQTITWTLVSPRAPGTKFARANGVVFKPGQQWAGPQPTPVGDSGTVFSVADNNNNRGAQPVPYAYGVNVVYNGTTYTYDPEVLNEPPAPVPLATVLFQPVGTA
jgi:hypothetical protein